MNKQKQPLVSVIIPVYNGQEYIGKSIESIIEQSYKNLELVLVDDCSTDNTWKVVKRYQKRYPKKIKAIKLKQNLGQGGEAAANVAFQNTKGDFIARMDADDISHPDRIKKQVKFMQNNPEYSVVGCNAFVIDVDGNIVGEKKVLTKHEEIYKNYFVFHPMINPTVLVRRSAIKGDKMYLTDNPTNNDYLTFMKMISMGNKFANLEEKLIYYRIHGANDSLKNVRRTFRNSLKTRARAVFKYGYRPTVLSIVKLMLQIILVYTVPQNITFNLYLLMRGIKKPSDYLPRISLPVSVRLKKVFSYTH